MSDWLEKDRAHIWHPFTPLITDDPVVITRGEGCYLYTDNDDPLLDLISSWWVNILGHAHPQIATAISGQANTLEQVIFAGFSHPPAIQLAEKVKKILPDEYSKVFFSDDGSTSTEVALKMAIQYWHNKGEERKKIIALEGAYHGDTFGAMSVGDRGVFNMPFFDYLFEVCFVPFPEGDGANSIEAMSTLADDETAAFIYEPLVQGAAGMRIYTPEVLQSMLETARRHDIICIADEVMTGFGRTGKLFASEYVDPKPDIFCLSKGLTGGFLPMGLTVMNDRIVKAFESGEWSKTFFHGHSYTANPLACAAANCSIDILTSESIQQKIKWISHEHQRFVERLHGLSGIHPNSLGTVLRIELVTDDAGYTSNLRDRMYRHFLDRGLLLRPLGNVLYLLPPYVIKEEDLHVAYDEIDSFLKNLS